MLLIYITLSIALTVVTSEKVLYAANFGGDTFKGSDGVVYQSNKLCVSKKFQRNVTFVQAHDLPLHQTGSNGYMKNFELPIAGNGFYVLTLKFPSPDNTYTMDVVLNGRHTVLENFNAVVNVTNVVTVNFEVYNDKMIWNDRYSDIQYHIVYITFNPLQSHSAWISAMKLTYTPTTRPEEVLQDIRNDLKRLVALMGEKDEEEL
jgi:Malectin domain